MFMNFDKIDNSLFWICALSGSALFALQFILNSLGALDGGDGDSSGDFKWLSKQAITGFIMMFGWIGLTCKKEFDFTGSGAFVLALVGGSIAMGITGFIFKMASKLHSSGTVFQIDEAVGKEAVVYQQIPHKGVGKISLSLQNFTHEIDAVSLGEEIPSFTQVRIIKKADDKTLVVIPIK